MSELIERAEEWEGTARRAQEANTRLVEKNRALEAEVKALLEQREALIIVLTAAIFKDEV